MMKEDKLEDKIKEIENIVKELKSENTDIGKSIEMYERGIKLIKEAEAIISTYEERIKNILEEKNDTKES
ncbi:TPA: exodeoxyribonuclease VII small subunit [candidate division WOR-3 bacterium]|uniref:Exodeoxyribonuclease 7 small subunit n=1 Tax=candidate division WOR-3 bacterium TaxID=2052148 RepID=A0A350H828_UNCW3|nr:exodeoxyribonuclease VII small subunit [candidate division WOR-3 bacterium]